MKISNKKNLPESIVKAISTERHTTADYSVSNLQNDAKLVHLYNRHFDELVVDVIDRCWTLDGNSFHYLFEKSNIANALSEEQLEIDINGVKLSGKPDYYIDNIIQDYKKTSVWKIKFADFKDWECQLNVYVYMMRKYNFPVNKIQVVLIARDWRLGESKQNSDYPPKMQVIDLKLWTEKEQEDYIISKIKILESMKDVPDNEIPECSPEKRWKSETVYKIMKKGNKRSTKNHKTLDGAEAHLKELTENDKKNKYSILPVPGEDKRCIDYCDCCTFCNYWQEKYGQKILNK